MPHLYEDEIKRAFVEVFNSLLTNREEILQKYSVILDTLIGTCKLNAESEKLLGEQAEKRSSAS